MFNLDFFDGLHKLDTNFESDDHAESSFSESILLPDLHSGLDINSESNMFFDDGINNSFEIQDFDSWHSDIYGEPIQDSLVWHQQTTPFTCGIVSSEMVLKMFGLDISESELVYEATNNGLLSDNGITIEGIQEILNIHGIDTHLISGGLSDLETELEYGHKIVIPLDSGEIWDEDSPLEDFFEERADHAVVLTGIDTDKGVVFLNDPGHPDGQAMKINIDKFTDAWDDSGNQFIATDDSPDIV